MARGEKPAFIDGPSERTLTYRGWAEGVQRVATGLAARGFRKGDVFAIFSPNVPEYAVAFHAVSLLGGINTTISPLYTVSELRDQLRDSGARYLVTVPACVGKAGTGGQGVGRARGVRVRRVRARHALGSLLAAECAPSTVHIDPHEDLVVFPIRAARPACRKG